MPNLKNTPMAYGSIAIFLHWISAILIIGLIILGLYMTGLPISLNKLKLYGWHKEFGLFALALVSLRLLWRWMNVLPALKLLPYWEQVIARNVHRIFFLFLFAMPLTGWIMSSAAGLPVGFFGWFVLPDLVAPNEHLRIFFQDIHRYLGYGLIALIGLHVLAALKHTIINKDDILQRMLP